VANSAAATTANTGGIVAVVTNNTQSSSAASNSAVVSAANTTAQTEVSRNSNVPAAVAVNRDENTGKLSVTATNGWTGRISVAVVDTSSGEAVESFVEIVITPAPVATPQINFTPPANLFIPPAPNTPNRPTINTGLTINWQPSNTEVTGYVVTVNEKVACTSTTNSCSINQIIGPKSKVEVFAQGNDNTFSPPVLLPEFKPAAPIPGLLVFFPLSSSRLTRAEVKKLDEFVVAMKVAGLNQVELQGHTDIQGTAKGFDNKTLSKNRAEIVANYLRKNLKVVTRKDQFADTKPAVIGNGEPVFKNNRRTEVLVW
jgi:outer membrane protein OmpA-like peptidoglycan-associated protein